MNTPDTNVDGHSFRPAAFFDAYARPVFGFTGDSCIATTTLLSQVAGRLRTSGYAVSAIKHTHRRLVEDQPTKDDCRACGAGCHEVLVIGDDRWMLMHEHCNGPEPSMEELLARMGPADIVLVEGFKTIAIPKIEVYRPSLGQTPIWRNDLSVLAVATDEEIECERTVLDINDLSVLADFIVECLRLSPSGHK